MITNKTNAVPPRGEVVRNDLYEQLEALRTQHEIAHLQREIAQLQSATRGQEVAEAAIINSVHAGYLYDSPNEAPLVHRSTFGDYLPDVPGNRDRGQDAVVFTTDGELAEIRGIARTLAWIDETTAGILRMLCRYVVGAGFDIEVSPKIDRKKRLAQIKADREAKAAARLAQFSAGPPAAEQPQNPGEGETDEPEQDPEDARREAIAERANEIVDETFKRLRFRRTFIRELQNRKRRDGEYFLRAKADASGNVRLQIIEPAEISEPGNPQALEAIVGEVLDWSFGIGTRPGDPSDVVAYYRNWGTNADDWEVIKAAEIRHVKVNVDSNVKRGVSDYYICYRNIERQAKITRNSGSGAAIQAGIAFIREWTNPTSPGDVSGRIGSSAGTAAAANPTSASRTVRSQSFEEGSIIDTYGAKYHSGPLGQQTLPAVIQICDAVKRHLGFLWGMPGWMVSGDATANTSYASAFVTESPFVKNCEDEQEDLVEIIEWVVERILDLAVRAGWFAEWGISRIADLLKEVAIHTERPSVSVRNYKELSDIYAELHNRKGCSLRTWVSKMGLDWEQEQMFLAEEPEQEKPQPFGMFGGQPFEAQSVGGAGPQPGQGDEAPRPGMPMAESEDVQEAKNPPPEPTSPEDEDEESDDETPPADPPSDPPSDEMPPSNPEPLPSEPDPEPEGDPEPDPEDEPEDEGDPQEPPKRKAGETIREWQERVAAASEGDTIEVVEDETPVGNEITPLPDVIESLDLTDEATRLKLAAKLMWSDY